VLGEPSITLPGADRASSVVVAHLLLPASSRLSFTCEFPPQVVNADGQLVTVRQPNKRKKDRTGAAGAAAAGGSADGQSEGSLDVKKRVKTQTGPRPAGKALVPAAASSSGGPGQSGNGVGPSPPTGASGSNGGLGGASGSQPAPAYLDSADQQPQGHHRTFRTTSSGIDQAVRPVFQTGVSGNGPLENPYQNVDGQSHFLQPRAMSSSSQGSTSSGFSLRQNYNPDHLHGSPNLPTSLLALDSNGGGHPAVSHATPASTTGDALSVNGGGRSYQASSEGGTGSIRERFDHLVAQRSSPMQTAVPNIAFDAPPGPQQQQQQQQQQHPLQPSHASITSTPDLFSRPFSPFSASVSAAVGNDSDAHNRMLQEMHRQFQQSFQQPTAAPSPSFSEWMKSFGDTMDSPGQIFGGDAAPKPGSNGGGGGGPAGASGLETNGFRPNVNGSSQADSPMTWLAPSPAPSSLHLGMTQTPVYQHSHLHSALQQSPLHQSQTPLHPPLPLPPTNGSTGSSQQPQNQLNFDGSRLVNGGSHFASGVMAPPRTNGQRMSPSQAPGSAPGGLAMNGGNRPYATSSHGTGGSQHHVSPPEAAWQTESLDPGYGPSAFIEPIPDEGDSDTRDFINGYTDGRPSTAGTTGPGSPIVRAGPNRSVTVSSRLAPPITIKLPELPQMIADQAPLLVDYFVRKLSPLISVLSPRKNAGAFQPASAALVGGSDIASVFVPMASQSKLMVRRGCACLITSLRSY
jgi:hypothetical protein